MSQINNEQMDNQMNNAIGDDVNDMEEAAKFTIITLADDDDETSSQKSKIIADCKAAINQLYANFREWLKENQDSEEVKARKEKVKQESDKLIQSAKEQLRKLQENENLRNAVNKGVQVAADTGIWVKDTLSEGISEFKKSESGQKVEAFVQDIKNDERVKQGVSSFKKGTLKLAESAFAGLKKVLDENQEEAEVREDETNNDI